MPRPLVAIIDIAAMQRNLAVAKQHAPAAKIWAIVKANAYGHGLARAARGFAAADGLGLIELDDAVRLREWGWKKQILLLEGFFHPEDLALLAQHSVQTVIHCNEQIAMLEQATLDAPLDVHLKMNSGMNRLGFAPSVFRAAYARLRAIGNVRNISLVTHFANAEYAEYADHPIMPVSIQTRRFQDGSAGLTGERSLSNSAAELLHPDVAADWVRPGIMLYGGTPGGRTAAEFGLLPAMTLTSEIIGMQDLAEGDAVGYGSRFIAAHPMKIGVVACGYADGYPRHAPSGTPVLVDGIRTRIVGQVSMDMMSVDLSAVPNARVGSKAILWGNGLPIDEVAHAAGTIGYELMCAVAPRVQIAEAPVAE
jgi:alanine racemase